MDLYGFSSPQTRTRGGICKIAMIAVPQIYQLIDNGNSEYQIYARNGWAEYDFGEDTALYTESISVDDGALSVVHTLEFRLPAIDSASRGAVCRLLERPEGVLAVITTPDSGMLLLGYSDAFGAAYPMRVYSCGSTSGKKPLDSCGRVVSLRRIDVSPACKVLKYE